MKKFRFIFYIVGIIIVIFILTNIFFKDKDSGNQITTKVKYGEFIVDVTITGELEAKSSEDIYGPRGLNTVGIWGDMKIEWLIAEGTIVDSGDVVARIDKTLISNKISDVNNELEKMESNFIKTKLDTTLELRNAREELVNLRYAYEEKQITFEQSKYEPPATQRQAKIEMEKAKRNLEQAIENYKLKQQKSNANMKEVTASFNQLKSRFERLLKVQNEFIVRAPKHGMVEYRKSWSGRKFTAGSTISPWNNIVAKLPDLSKMVSRTYVNEIDVSKVNKGLSVKISIDAFPEKSFTGKITSVANMGEQLQGSEAKVYEVLIMLNEYDTILRPAMTTKNKIITNISDSVLFVPLECIHSNDSVSYVYTKRGRKQEVITGKSNENEIIITKGVEKDDELLLTIPENADDIEINMLEGKGST